MPQTYIKQAFCDLNSYDVIITLPSTVEELQNFNSFQGQSLLYARCINWVSLGPHCAYFRMRTLKPQV